MKKYNFDEIIERKGTSCVKHDGMLHDYGREDLLPMWVADMDWKSPDFVIDALRERLSHEVLGYAAPSRSYWDTMRQWLRNRYRIETLQQELHFIPGIVSGIAFAIQSFTAPGDKILVMNPVYPPFLHLPEGSHRELSCSKLKVVDGRFSIDFDDLDLKARGCRMMILSNPHNPGGTVWTRDDLKRISEICHRHNLVVIADEIHADLTLPGYHHVSYSTVGPEARDHSITFIAPSKTFNIAGLGSSICYVPNLDIRRQLFGYLDTYEVANGNIFAYVGAEAAFKNGEDWLSQMLAYLQNNVHYLGGRCKDTSSPLHLVDVVLPEASYLAWLDFKAYGLSHEELRDRFINQARVAMNDGTNFGGADYECCFRINLGCPMSILKEALDRIENVL